MPFKGTPKQLTDKEATKILGQMMYAHGVLGKFDARATDVVSGASNNMVGGQLDDILKGIERPGAPGFKAGRAARKFIGMEEGTNLKFWDVRGVGGRTESGFGPLAAGEEIGHFVEGQNRAAPFINLLKKGVDPAEAAKRVGAAQILYGNKNYTAFEQQVMSRVFPFYKFTRGLVPQVIQQLAERPGGKLAQAVRAQRLSQDKDELAPDYVRESASIPLGDALGPVPEGTDRYLAGLGLMHEDAFSFGPNMKGAGLELLGRTNPFIKAPLEMATGQSFFQKGPEGGRPLDDLDPLIGRLYANVTRSEDPARLPQWLEQTVANSPLARGLSTARQLTDRRKSWGGDSRIPGPASLLNVLTGLRITDVSPGSKDAIVRELLTKEQKDAGAAAFEVINFKTEDLAKMSPKDREHALRLQAFRNVLVQRSKDRAAAKNTQ